MRHTLSLCLGALFLMGASWILMESEPKKRALIIAIGNYPRTSGWAKLSSLYDAEVLYESLNLQGFDEIIILKDDKATKEGIQETFQRKLLKPAKAGDIVMVHFSGHGQQIWDREDEQFPGLTLDEIDGFDEALIPFDARDEFRPGVYEGEKHLTDDEIQAMLTSLRRKLGPKGQILFTVDACHSGTINRSEGLLKIRGTVKRFGPNTNDLTLSTTSEGKTGLMESFEVVDENQLAKLIVISASRADQPNYEALDEQGRPIGSLSLALSRKLAEAKGRLNYDLFFQRLKKEMAMVAPSQSPQLEGDASLELFVDERWMKSGFALLEFRRENQVWIEGGRLLGMYPGTTVELKQIDGPAEVLVKGLVMKSELSRALIKLESSIPMEDLDKWRAELSSRFNLATPVRLHIAVIDEAFSRQFMEKIIEVDQVQIVDDNAELSILQAEADAVVSVVDLNQKELISLPADEKNAVDRLLQRVQKYAQAKYLRTLEIEHQGREALLIEAVPVSLERDGNTYHVKEFRQPELGSDSLFSQLELGTNFIFRITNQTSQPLFFTVLATDSDDEVALLVPDAYSSPEAFVINPETTIELREPAFIFQIAPPRGKEVFTLITSPEAIDLRPVFRQPDIFTDPGLRNLEDFASEQLVASLLFSSTRSESISGSEIQIVSTTIEIP